MKKIYFICLFFLPFFMGCGSSGTPDDIPCGDHTISNLPAETTINQSLALRKTMLANCIPPSLYELTSSTGETLLDFYTNEHVDFSNVTVERNDTAAFVSVPSDWDQNDLDYLMLHIPCTTDVSCLRVCPGADSFDAITDDCNGGDTLTSDSVVGTQWFWNNPTDRGATEDCTIESDQWSTVGAKGIACDENI